MNIDNLIASCISYIQTNHPNRTQEINKCERDLKYIIEAIIKDIDNNTTTFTKRIANRFWYDDKRQLVSYETELATYSVLLEELKKELDTKSINLAENSINILCNIIKNGPVLDDLGTTLVQDVVKAEHCQRNWNHDYVMPEEDIDALVKVATTMPTKQNRNYYDLIVSTDKELNNKIYSLAADLDNPDTPSRNSQVNANALFIYVWNYDFKNDHKMFKDNHGHNTAIAVGISSGALSLAAAQLDYRVGFCQCFLKNEIVQELRNKGIDITEGANIELLVGIGKPNTDYTWNKVLNEDASVKKTIIPFVKKINVSRI